MSPLMKLTLQVVGWLILLALCAVMFGCKLEHEVKGEVQTEPVTVHIEFYACSSDGWAYNLDGEPIIDNEGAHIPCSAYEVQ